MAILIDPPVWPAHGTVWSHLVSDSDLAELHAFAFSLGVPRRGFDLDHYDVPASLHARAVSLGARAVTAKELVHALRLSGLRVKGADRPAAYVGHRMDYLRSEWRGLGTSARPGENALPDEAGWIALGEKLLARWTEPHRTYHDARHLEDVLLALNQLEVWGAEVAVVTKLAAWFHDAVYDGVTGDDERASAELAHMALTRAGIDNALAETVHDFVLATIPAEAPAKVPPELAHLLDADLSIFAASAVRYDRYANAVRAEYAHVPDVQFALGRARILESYAAQAEIYRTGTARDLWEAPARVNLAREIARLRSVSSA